MEDMVCLICFSIQVRRNLIANKLLQPGQAFMESKSHT